MDRGTAENNDGFSQPEQVSPTPAPPPLLHEAEGVPPKQITDSSFDEVNTSSNVKASSPLPPEIVESKCEDDSKAHYVQTSGLLHKEADTVRSASQTSETTVESHSSDLQSSSSSMSATTVVDKLATGDVTKVGQLSEQAEVEEIESLSSASSHVLDTPLREDSGVSPDGSSSDLPKSYEERKSNIVEDQSEVEAGSSEKPTNDIESELVSHRSTSSDVNASLSETQMTVSCLESPAGAVAAMSLEGAVTNSCIESVYYIKWIMFGQSNVPIITQNENGPCPLLAIMNVLLLKEKVKLAPMLEMITSEQLMTYLGECIFENMPQNLSETTQANYEQNMQDAMSVMYKLQTGLDVNVKFTGAGDFEYTPEMIIFDLLEISLYHGWLVDPQDSDTVTAINQCSYNQLVEKIISLRQSEEEDSVRQALIAEQFLERSASQLTYHGLCELSSVVKEKELCIFFRNNHFNTLYKHNNELFLLMTDQGFLTESNVVWETLSNVDGDCHFTDATFRTYTKPVPAVTVPIPDPSIPVGSPEQIDHDYQVALFLQEEDASMQKQTSWRSGTPQEQTTYTDHELALRLQEEENRKITEEHERRVPGAAVLDTLSQQQGQGRPVSHGAATEGQRRRPERGERKEDKGCSVL